MVVFGNMWIRASNSTGRVCGSSWWSTWFQDDTTAVLGSNKTKSHTALSSVRELSHVGCWPMDRGIFKYLDEKQS